MPTTPQTVRLTESWQAALYSGHASRLLVWVLAAGLIASPPAARAQQGNVVLDSNEQLFCVLAALNAAGYDSGLGSPAGDDTREQVRNVLEQLPIPVRDELRKFYADHREVGNAAADLAQFVSLALFLGPPPQFSFTVPETDLPPDAKALKGFVPLLRRFYQQADLQLLWAKVRPRYDQALARYGDEVRHTIALTDAYLRFPAGAYLGRTYTINLCLLGAPEQVQARIYGENYYLVITPSAQLKLAEIRHQYLHFLLDPLAVKYAAEIHQKASLQEIARRAPALSSDFKEDFSLLVTECLIRAAELRMDKMAQPDRAVGQLTASGLILVPYFYQALDEFRRQPASMSVFYKEMILKINLKDERQRLASVKFAGATSPASGNQVQGASPPLSPKDRLLNQADDLIFEGKYIEAKAAFQEVLQKFDPKDERALFGIAVADSNLRKPDLAEEYFLKTLDVARDLRIVTWSHIYLGRLYDVEGKREAALAQYRSASVTASAYPSAVAAVQAGLRRPFGSQSETKP